MFHEFLNACMKELACTPKELAAASGLPSSTISRYRSGSRTPAPDSPQLSALAEGLAACAAARGQTRYTPEVVLAGLVGHLPDRGQRGSDALFARKLNALAAALDIHNRDFARILNFDPSYISKVRSGERRFADPARCSSLIAQHIAWRFTSDGQVAKIADLVGAAYAAAPEDARAEQLGAWLMTGPVPQMQDPIDRFLKKLDAFDLDQYLRAANFDQLVVPPAAEVPEVSRPLYGLDQMKAGELEFLKLTALSEKTDPILMYSDMPMDVMSQDAAFVKNWLLGLATALKKGLRFDSIHDVERPLPEMMLGLEAWIPLYMTGQIAPYYLPGTHSQVFLHFLRVSGAAAVEGSAIGGHHADGRYYITNKPDEVKNYQLRARHLLRRARPLMQICRADDAEPVRALLEAEKGSAIVPMEDLPFRNIQIRIQSGAWVLLSKTNAPAMHFIIRHPKLVRAIEDFCRDAGMQG